MRIDCRFFNGYKPCGHSTHCDQSCSSYQKRGPKILLIHLGALGAVVRSTALLKAIHRQYPNCELSWITSAPANHLLQNHSLLHKVYTTSQEDLLAVSAQVYDVVLCVDKSLTAAGILRSVRYEVAYGFGANDQGVIIPLNHEANELWQIGLSDQIKFFENTKTECQLIHEALKLGPYHRDPYFLPLTKQEEEQVKKRRQQILNHCAVRNSFIVGINTGCAGVIPYKKLSLAYQKDLIRQIQKRFSCAVALLGGPEDTQRNEELALEIPSVFNTETRGGLRDGLVSVASCDLVISGDSLGMHMAISQGVYTLAWFGPTCAHEIDFFGRGLAIQTEAECAPCWKRTCNKERMCYDQVDMNKILSPLEQQIAKSLNSSYDEQNQIAHGFENELFEV